MNEALMLAFRAPGHFGVPAFHHNANPLLDRPSALPNPHARVTYPHTPERPSLRAQQTTNQAGPAQAAYYSHQEEAASR